MPEPPASVVAGTQDPLGTATDARVTDGADTSAKPARVATDLEFNPLLSPHTYLRSTGVGPAPDGPPVAVTLTGVLLIDHGWKWEASNAHIHNIA